MDYHSLFEAPFLSTVIIQSFTLFNVTSALIFKAKTLRLQAASL